MAAKKKRSTKKTGATRHPDEGSSKLSMAVIVILVASFAGFLIYLDKIPADGDKQATSNKKQPVSQKTEIKNSKPAKHQFDFYTVLPDREVKVNHVEKSKPVRKPHAKSSSSSATKTATKPVAKTTPKKNQPQSSLLYQLQVGAFSELSKADAMKARLAFLGVESNIQVIQNNGRKMYRVRVGPSTDGEKINRIKDKLKAQNINTFVQKLNG